MSLAFVDPALRAVIQALQEGDYEKAARLPTTPAQSNDPSADAMRHLVQSVAVGTALALQPNPDYGRALAELARVTDLLPATAHPHAVAVAHYGRLNASIVRVHNTARASIGEAERAIALQGTIQDLRAAAKYLDDLQTLEWACIAYAYLGAALHLSGNATDTSHAFNNAYLVYEMAYPHTERLLRIRVLFPEQSPDVLIWWLNQFSRLPLYTFDDWED